MFYDIMLVEGYTEGTFMTETEKRRHRVCFTGHRSEKLTRAEWLIKKDLEKEIRQAIADGKGLYYRYGTRY